MIGIHVFKDRWYEDNHENFKLRYNNYKITISFHKNKKQNILEENELIILIDD